MSPQPQYAGPWLRIRKEILTRDDHQCQIRLPGCTVRATAVDHIIPADDGGAWWEPSNLRATCQGCNNRRKRGRLKTAKPQVERW